MSVRGVTGIAGPWGGLTPHERRIVAWIVLLLVTGALSREIHHRQLADRPVPAPVPAER